MKRSLLVVALVLLGFSGAFAQSGKIAGTVTDAETNQPLPGVNVVVVGTDLGAATDAKGNYTILNVPPGTYQVRAQMIGYAATTQTDVSVAIGLTRTLDFQLQVEAIAGQEVVVEASQPVVQRDISGTQRNISTAEIQSSAHQSMSGLLTNAVGVDVGTAYDDRPTFRGGSMNGAQFIVDGIVQKDPLNNNPNMRLNLAAVQEVKVETGGFSAQYGNLQSGLVNVVTKEGGDRYSGSIDYQYSPPGIKHFGPNVYSFESPLMIPFVDTPEGRMAGSFTGYHMDANGNPVIVDGDTVKNNFFSGWNNVAASDAYMTTPMEAYARYLWRHRTPDSIEELKKMKKDGTVPIEWAPGYTPAAFQQYGNVPDYNLNATLGGPLPFIPKVKFFLSYAQNFLEYQGHFAQINGYSSRQFRSKLTGNLTDNIKLMVQYYNNWEQGGDGGQGPGLGGFISRDVFGQWGAANKMWYRNCGVPADQVRQYFTARLTHTLSSKTYYDIQATYTRSDYSMLRDYRDAAPVKGSDYGATTSSATQSAYMDNGMIGSTAYADSVAASGELGWDNWTDWRRIKIGDYWFDEGPQGYGPVNWRDITGEYRMESCNIRISDTYSRQLELKGQLVSQLTQNHQLTTGFEVRRNTFKQYYAQIDPSVNGGSIYQTPLVNPWDGALYAEDKMEYGGFVANLGLRADWLVHDKYPLFNGDVSDKLNGPYTTLLEPGRPRSIDSLWATPGLKLQRATHFTLSPRLGISHPIATTAKIYFNYGHAYMWPDWVVDYRAQIETTHGNKVENFGNPMVAPERLIMYELGYEHNLFNKMSLTVSGYYKDLNSQVAESEYNYIDGNQHDFYTNREFSDIRGAEFRLELRRGAFPFVAGWVSADYRVESGGSYGTNDFYEDPTHPPELESREVSQADVRPIIKFNLNFNTPRQFGPQLGGIFHPVGGINLDLMYKWQRGEQFTWNPNNYPLVENNVRWRPYQRWDLRFRKQLFTRGTVTAQFYMDIFNVFNNKNMTRPDQPDVNAGLAWDSHKWWNNQFRNYMESLHMTVNPDGSITGKDRPGDYPRNGKKDYIDMPDFTPLTFLEKRDIYFGINFLF